jgi:Trk-type K+ transport system membrane component
MPRRLRYRTGWRPRDILSAIPGPTQSGYPTVGLGDASLGRVTTLQQALIHLGLVLVAVAAVVVLAATGNGDSTVYGLILAITGFGNIGVAGVGATPTPTPAPAVPTPKAVTAI